MDTEDLYLIRDTEDLEIEEIIDETITNKEFDKLKNFEILLKNREEKSKFLIFSEFDISFDKIIKILKKNNIKYSFLKGNKYMIQNIINNFKTGELDILLINIYNYGSGMNLECASDIVMFHKFDKSIEHQVIGRGQRFGRKNSLNIHYLLNENEVSII